MSSPIDKPEKLRKSPARLDLTQSLTGLALALFTWLHLTFDASIILGHDSLYWVGGMLEGKFLTGGTHGYPIIITIIGIVIFTLFVIHAFVAIRKFPASFKQHRIVRNQMAILNHQDTNLWYVQFITGFILFFVLSVHVYVVSTRPDQIDPFLSSDRFVSENMWPLFLVLVVAVILHANIGMYRLAVKWGVFDGKSPRANRKRFKAGMWILIVFFMTISLWASALYIKTGIEHRDNAGERYVPTHSARGDH